jgi:hypothetical protein
MKARSEYEISESNIPLILEYLSTRIDHASSSSNDRKLFAWKTEDGKMRGSICVNKNDLSCMWVRVLYMDSRGEQSTYMFPLMFSPANPAELAAMLRMKINIMLGKDEFDGLEAWRVVFGRREYNPDGMGGRS